MTNEPVSVQSQFTADRDIGYTLLSDRKAEAIGAFGLINQRFPRSSKWYGIAHPMLFVIDPNGVITHRFSNTDHRNQPSPGVILEALRKHAKG